MRRITGCLPLAAALLVLAACGDDGGGEAGSTTSATAEPSSEASAEPTGEPADAEPACAAGEPELTVTEAGAEPLTVMELAPSAGDTVALDMRVSMEGTTAIDGGPPQSAPIPAMLMGFQATVDEVTDDEIAMSFVYDKAEMESEDPAVAQSLAPIVGMTGTITTTRNGAFVDGAVDTSGLSPELMQAMGELDAQLEQLTVPLPVDPVGVGAVWTVSTGIDVNGILYCSDVTYHLTEFDGDAYTLETEVTQEAQPTTIEDATGSLEVIEGTGSGSGTSSGSLSFPVAVSGASAITTHLALEMSNGTDGGELVTDLTLGLEISPRE
ncbi:hypothetical protein [Jiangella anatolica]|uniref:Bacterial spore germination immunoglobulin-like domain-containing protein n=1 Tax=Jiangella anatolica TaxID=2670374 RepID=A0A2W2AW30_9ACTN|nr:hypothetical protein [Jiangella anatolica]PZF79425.1 hypothetical protein C1I92_31245 [Jiangella anatolica]